MTLFGNLTDYLAVFGGGIIVSFSPCVFPLIPVTLGYIGVKSRGSKVRGLALSLLYVLGLAVTYSILGLIAALTGKLFGRISVHPITQIVVGNIFIFLGLSFFDIFNVPVFGIFRQNKIKTGSLWSVFLFGLVSGLVVGPCTAPALGAILLYVATGHNIIRGTTLLFTFAYGVGAVLILTATAGGFLRNLLKSGVWLNWVNKLGGLILILAGEYFLINAGRAMW
jgi:cytochrome c-type biogenesis protein